MTKRGDCPRFSADGQPVRRVFLILIVAIAVCGSMLGLVITAATSPKAMLLGELPERVAGAAPLGEDVLVAAEDAGLFLIKTEGPEVVHLYKVRGQQIVDVFVSEDVVYAIAHVKANRSKQLHVVDVASGTVKKTHGLGGSVSHVPGFMPDGRLIVIEGGQVRLMDLRGGRSKGRVPVSGGLLGRGHLVGTRLYVSRSYDGGIAVLDMTGPKLLEVIAVEDWLRRVMVVGRQALVTGTKQGVGLVDLDTHEYRTLDLLDYASADSGEVFALDAKTLWRWDYAGERSLQRKIPGKLARELKKADVGKVELLWVSPELALVSIGKRIWRLQFPAPKG